MERLFAPGRGSFVDGYIDEPVDGCSWRIADADVAKMTMYRPFFGKNGLIVEVLRYRTERFNTQLDDLAKTVAMADETIATMTAPLIRKH
ncbi:hypothetical protein FB593_11613 [Rhizobium sp. SJZ105]|nr:hypothetical protein FB593_11613 [Rhizobium sp. SJZ105]